jgi:hypothetical protein
MQADNAVLEKEFFVHPGKINGYPWKKSRKKFSIR